MTHKDKQDVISVCNILADKMSDSGKVAVQQIIGAVEDMVENESCEDCISRAEAIENFASWYGYDYDNQGYYRLLKQIPSVTPSYNSVKTSHEPRRDLAETSQDTISREEVRQLICKNNDKYGYSDRFHEFTEECLQLPLVTPQPKRGKWIEVELPPYGGFCKCPSCGSEWDFCDNDTERFEYYPRCGMDLRENKE